MAHPGHDGMWLPPDQDPRAEAGPTRGERDTLVGYLEHYRTTLGLKCDSLTPTQLGTRSVPPSAISLLGLVRHMARVEHHWFRRVIENHDIERLFSAPDEDAGFGFEADLDQAFVDDAFTLWRREVEHAQRVLAADDLDRIVTAYGKDIEVRDVIVHLIEEYARHVGHADLVREAIDGRTGE